MKTRPLGAGDVVVALTLPWVGLYVMNGGIEVLDFVVLASLYVAYIAVVLHGNEEPGDEHVGTPAYLQANPCRVRVLIVLSLFAYSGLVIFTAVEPFAHGLVTLGEGIGGPSFFMLQWIAPLASESPELIVVVYLVSKARSTVGFNALISSKLNQWTLLIGTLVVVYSLALGRYGALPFDGKQAGEIWLTAAQSFFALSLLSNFELSGREALALLVLFITQVLVEVLIIREVVALPLSSYEFLLAFAAVYVVLGIAVLAVRRAAARRLMRRSVTTVRGAVSGGGGPLTGGD